MTRNSDITIIGGGIIGLLTAREFIRSGATVTLIDQNAVGQESSWAGGGILLPLYPWRQHPAISQLVLHSLTIYPQLTANLRDDTGLNPEWRPCGLLITKNPDADSAIDWCKTHHVQHTIANPDFFSGLNITPDNPLWLPEIAHVRNPRLLKSLKQDLINKGCRFYEHCQMTGIGLEQHRITALNTSYGQLPINHLVIASGAWTSQIFQTFFPEISHSPNIKPVKGQMLLYEAKPDTLLFMVLDGDHYLIPRLDGKILAGSTVEYDEFDKSTHSEAKDKLNRFALDLLPSLNQFPLIRHWAGLRPGTELGIPYILKHPEFDNLSINAGHFRNGLAMGPASAQLLVDLVLNRPPCVAAEPYQFTSPH